MTPTIDQSLDAEPAAAGCNGMDRRLGAHSSPGHACENGVPAAISDGAGGFESNDFTYLASHQLHAPLRIISGYGQLLLDKHAGDRDEESQLWLQHIVDGSNAMHSLLKGLLTFSLAGQNAELRRAVSCELVLDQALLAIDADLQATAAVITRDPLPVVVANVPELLSVFQHLLDNALRYRGDDPPHIHVGSRQAGAHALFQVSDNGQGIALKDFERIFNALSRLPAASTQTGCGLGLAICRKIVQRHGGTIWVESRVGVGSTFHFSMPLASALSA